jgi:hypothetical protein
MPSQINWGHPLANGLAHYWPLNEGGGQIVQDLVIPSHNLSTTNSPSREPMFSGVSLRLASASSQYVSKTSPDFADDTKGSFVILYQILNYTSGVALCWPCTSGATTDEFPLAYYRGDSSGQMQVGLVVSGSTTLAMDTSSSWLAQNTKQHMWAVTSDGSTIKGYGDGISRAFTISVGSNTGQWLYNATNLNIFTIGVCKRATPVIYLDGRVAFAAYYKRAITASEAAWLFAEPYCFIQPKVNRYYSIPTRARSFGVIVG